MHFVFPLHLAPAVPITAANVEIRGGTRVRDPAVTGVDAQGDLDIFDQLIEDTSETGEPGQPEVSQDPAWRPAGATEVAQ